MRNYFIFNLFFIPLIFALPVYAEISKPDIQTYNTATSSTVIIKAPSGYKSQVVSTYDGDQFHTTATSTPLTDEDIQQMRENTQAQISAMQKMFEYQEAMLREQRKMFESIWGDDFDVVVPVEKVQKSNSAPKTPKKVPAVSTSTPPSIISATATPTPEITEPTRSEEHT
ncbi:MAG: hypothetical protein PHS95_00940, partial [Candidatus Pacebacteria bacterium]|nr:hypothetical protein [Candidatus Paceibacterota bacterium]